MQVFRQALSWQQLQMQMQMQLNLQLLWGAPQQQGESALLYRQGQGFEAMPGVRPGPRVRLPSPCGALG